MERLSFQTILIAISIVTMVAGIAGMFYCLPFLYSKNLADLVGAGFPFLAGAVLFVGGLISASVLTIKKKTE